MSIFKVFIASVIIAVLGVVAEEAESTAESRVCGLYSSHPRCIESAEQWENDFNNLKEWVTSAGGFVHPSLYLGWNPVSGRGLYLREAQDNQTILLNIPATACLHNQTIHQETLAAEVLRVAPKGSWNQHTLFSIAVNDEKGKGAKSKWAPFISTFPSPDDFSTLPYHWPRSEFNAVKGSFFVKLVTNQMATIMNTWTALTKQAPSVASKLTQEGFVWGYLLSVQNTRWANYTHTLVDIPGYGLRPNVQPGFAPFFDLLNHPTPAAIYADKHTGPIPASINNIESHTHATASLTTVLEVDPRIVTLTLDGPIAAGEQVFLFYGDFDNGHLLSNFGFISSPSNVSRAWLPLDLPKDAVGFKEKIDFFKGKSVQSCIIGLYDSSIQPCLGFLRVATGPVEIIPRLKQFSFGPEAQGLVSIDLEVPALKHLANIVKKTTADYAKIKVIAKGKDGKEKVEKVAATGADEDNVAWKKYSEGQRKALHCVLEELQTLGFWESFSTFFSTLSSIEEGDLSQWDHVKHLHYVKELIKLVEERRSQFDVEFDEIEESESPAPKAKDGKKLDQEEKIEL